MNVWASWAHRRTPHNRDQLILASISVSSNQRVPDQRALTWHCAQNHMHLVQYIHVIDSHVSLALGSYYALLIHQDMAIA